MMEKSGREQGSEYRYYVEGQVLIAGPESEIREVVAEVKKALGVELALARGGEGDSLQLRWEPPEDDSEQQGISTCLESVLPDLSSCLEEPLVMCLYRIDQPERVETVVEFINREASSGPCVRADPNWLTGYKYPDAGEYHLTASSPYSAAGSPFSHADAEVGPDDFWGQWALERIGLIGDGERKTRRCGQGVRVGVFDTSPFADGGKPVPAILGHPPLLTVVHPDLFESFPVPAPQDVAGVDLPELKSHGLSVAGLVYAVAPHSDIYLYKVLDEYARGNLFVLCSALLEFMHCVLGNPDAPNGGIINLSLGVPLPYDWQNRVGAESVFALDIVLALAHCQGLTVVAAAGNRSAGLAVGADPEFPACRSHVIGVMASNHGNIRSCFSNNGDLAAPGGDGYNCSEDEKCQCPWDEAAASERYKYGLIGPVLPTQKFPKGFARWLGTSFATPLVSGMAALILQHHGGSPPAGVAGEILNHVNPGGAGIQGGIIDVQSY